MDIIEEKTAELMGEFKGLILDERARFNRKFDELNREIAKQKVPGIRISSDLDREAPEMKAYTKFLRQGPGVLDEMERKVLTVGTDISAGYLAPAQVASELIKGITEISPIRQIAKVISISRESIEIPRRTGTGSAAWTTETATRTETLGFAVGLERVTPHECYYLAKVSQQLLEDNAYGLENELMGVFSEKFAQLEGAGFVSGTGVGQPEGLWTKVVDGTISSYHSGDAAKITAAGIMALPFQISTQYWPNARFLLSRASLFAIRTLVDPVSGLYLFAPAMDKTPDRIAGFPYTLTEDLEGPDTGHYPVIFGDFGKGYLVVDRVQLQVQRLAEKYIEVGQVGFHARLRTTGQVVLPEAMVALECAV